MYVLVAYYPGKTYKPKVLAVATDNHDDLERLTAMQKACEAVSKDGIEFYIANDVVWLD